ncbi:MAG: ATPase, T2SS/T4P/T4SS family [Phycisphaerales bacterium JB063]
MTQLLIAFKAEPVFLMSILKPIMVLLVLGPWAWLVGRLDKDAGYFYLKRHQWSLAHIAAGIVGFGLLLVIPIFWVGLPIALLILGGEALAYVAYRNKQVPEEKKWDGKTLTNFNKKMEARAGKAAQERAQIKLMDKSERLLDVPHGNDPRTPAFELFENMLVFAIPRGADLLDIAVDAEKAKFVARIDGVRYAQQAPETQLCVQLIEYLKEHAGLDTTDRRRKQKGKMWVELDGGMHTLELTTAGSTRALTLSIEIDPQGRLDIPIDHLGLTPAQRETVKELVSDNSKVILFCSPPGKGTTTSMYAFMQEHDPYTSSVMTFEEEIAFDIEGVNHNTHVAGGTPDEIQAQFASLLRADPDVMMVSKVLSTEMAQLIAKSAEDTRFYLPLPAKDTISGLKTWIKVVGDKRLAAESVAALVSQRLVRRLCHTCRAPYQPDEAALKKLNVPASQVGQLYRASGQIVVKDRPSPCPDCHTLCYRGRVGVFEIMLIDRQAAGFIASGEGEKLRAHLRKHRMIYLQEAALAKVVEGISDIKEVTRVMGEKG